VTSGAFVSGAREILPSPQDDLPKDLLKAFQFTAALPSPPLPLLRLAAKGEQLRTRLYSAVEVTPDVRTITKAAPPAAPESDPAPVVAEVIPPPQPVIAPDPVVSDTPPAPIVPGIVIVKGFDKKSPKANSGSGSGNATKAYVVPTTFPRVPLMGAGAAGPAELYRKWSQEFTIEAVINYMPVGAGSGLQQLKKGEIDFAASESPVADSQFLHFPTAVTAVVPIYNVPGIYDALYLTPEALAGIYLGEIRYWNDQRIAAYNPRASLPPAQITIVHRSEGSATTFTWTDYLSKIGPEWKAKLGAAASVNWPVAGLAGKGNDGVAQAVHQTLYSIGYVDYPWAMQNKVSFAAVRNRSGQFVFADWRSMADAALEVNELPASITDSPRSSAYPIASFSYMLVPQRIGDPRKRTAMSDFLHWMLTEGQKETSKFQYAPLPGNVALRARNQIAKIKGQ
jgi:phosphate transport system substrate-binding protein